MQAIKRLFTAPIHLHPLKPESPRPILQSNCFVNTLARITQANTPDPAVPAATIWMTLLGLHNP